MAAKNESCNSVIKIKITDTFIKIKITGTFIVS